MLSIKTLHLGELGTNCYLLIDSISHEALVVDPADAPEYISEVLLRESLIPIGILATHGHFDHIMGVFGLQSAFNIPFYVHPDDMFIVDRMVDSARHFLKRNIIDPKPIVSNRFTMKGTLKLGAETVQTIHVPGHTPGSVALYVPSILAMFVGDTFFADGKFGRTDTSYGDHKKLFRSIEHMLECNVAIYYPGHGDSLSSDRAKGIFGV